MSDGGISLCGAGVGTLGLAMFWMCCFVGLLTQKIRFRR